MNKIFQNTETYPAFPLAILSSISFLDFKMIDHADRMAATEKYEIKVQELEQKEEKEAKLKEKQNQEQRELQDRTDAFVSHVRALTQKMYEEDIDGEIMNQIPGLNLILFFSFKQKLQNI